MVAPAAAVEVSIENLPAYAIAPGQIIAVPHGDQLIVFARIDHAMPLREAGASGVAVIQWQCSLATDRSAVFMVWRAAHEPVPVVRFRTGSEC